MNLLRAEHPRPDFKRELWSSLNGSWNFDWDPENRGEKERWFEVKEFTQKITVPFTYQSSLSGIEEKKNYNYLWYKRDFVLPESFGNREILLKFGAVDYYAKVWINGQYTGSHRGGYSSFSIDISAYLKEKSNTIVVRVEDLHNDRGQVRGKQMWTDNQYECWYTGYSGIWQSVWIEAVPEIYLDYVKILPDVDAKKVQVVAEVNSLVQDVNIKATVSFQGKIIAEICQQLNSREKSLYIDLEEEGINRLGLHLWSPEKPNLYDITLEIIDGQEQVLDSVDSYFGMRKVSVEKDHFLINNVSYYQKLIMDQGYFPGGGITPDSEEIIISDIKMIKEMGFNGVRKHQKVEDPLFLYWCDRLGLLVWEEMPSFYRFSSKSLKNYTEEWSDIIRQNFNHPSIVVRVVFNESWGVGEVYHDEDQQNAVKGLYYFTKAQDPTRPVIDNDGWEHTVSDLCTIHDYEQDGSYIKQTYANRDQVLNGTPSRLFPRFMYSSGHKYKGEPVLMSEFGGIALNAKDGWGYGSEAASGSELEKRLEQLFQGLLTIPYLRGYCYTQFTDVEHEKNGLLTIDRKLKIDLAKIKSLNRKMYSDAAG